MAIVSNDVSGTVRRLLRAVESGDLRSYLANLEVLGRLTAEDETIREAVDALGRKRWLQSTKLTLARVLEMHERLEEQNDDDATVELSALVLDALTKAAPKPPDASVRFFEAIEAIDIDGYVAHLKTLTIARRADSASACDRIDEAFYARSRESRELIRRRIAGIHAAAATRSDVGQEALEVSRLLMEGMSPPPVRRPQKLRVLPRRAGKAPQVDEPAKS